jgi:hypothetical protein
MDFSFTYGVSLSFYFKENSPDLLYIFLDIEAVSLFITIFIDEVSDRFILLLKRRKSSSRLKLTRKAVRVYDNKLNRLVTLRILKLAVN